MIAVRSTDPARVLFLCPLGFGVRNVVHSGLLTHLRGAGMQPHLLVPREWDQAALAEQAGEGACGPLLDTPMIGSRRGLPAVDALLRESFARRYGLTTRRILDDFADRQRRPAARLRKRLIRALAIAGCREPLFSWQRRHVRRRIRATTSLEPIVAQLSALQPSLIVSTSCIAAAEEPYLLAAQELGVRCLACILSFDNLTSRGLLPVFDFYAVWNDRMRRQVLQYYPDRNPAQIFVTGTPQFDFHVRSEHRWSRAETLRVLGLGTAARYVVYGANHEKHTPTEPALVERLVAACAATPELRDHHIVLRPHPLDQSDRWRALAGTSQRVLVSWPWQGAGMPAPDDHCRMVNALRYADAVMDMASTISLDAAAVDTPVVCVGFAAEPGSAEDRFALAAHGTDHFRPILATGGVRLARSMDELVRELIAYVQNPSRDRAARARLAAQECGTMDGRAAERVAALIAALVRQQASGTTKRPTVRAVAGTGTVL